MTPWARIPGRPVPYARTGGLGRRRYTPGRKGDPTTHRGWEAMAVPLLREVAPPVPLLGPVGAVVVAVYPRPKTRPASVPAEWWTHGGRVLLPSGRGDLDNVVKLVLDCVTQAGWWLDDRHVASLQASRVYAADGEGPAVEVHASRLWPDHA